MNLKTIFSEGKKERRRRRSISRDNRCLKAKQTDLSARLVALGQKAWGEKIDLTAFLEVKSGLEANQAQLDDLKRKSDDCLKRKEERESEKKRHSARFAEESRGIEEKKKTAFSLLNKEKDLMKTLQKSLSQAENRSQQIAKEREQLQKQITDAATPTDQKAGHEKHLQELAGEEAGLLGARRDESEAIKTQNEKIGPLQAESDNLQKQIQDVLSRQKETLGGIEKNLSELRKELEGHQAKAKEVEKAQTEAYRQLGEKLAAGGDSSPSLNAELGAVREAEREIENIKAKIVNLGSQQSPGARGAYKKMIAILIGGLGLFVTLIVAALILF